MNLCRSCRQDFTGERDFDSHRVGTHAYTLREGLRMDPPVEDGRRCLTIGELVGKGWYLDMHGRWSHPRRLSKQVPGTVTVPARQSGDPGAA